VSFRNSRVACSGSPMRNHSSALLTRMASLSGRLVFKRFISNLVAPNEYHPPTALRMGYNPTSWSESSPRLCHCEGFTPFPGTGRPGILALNAIRVLFLLWQLLAYFSSMIIISFARA
jgi:hypothetical protein